MLLFRRPISRLFDRTEKISVKGLRTYPDSQFSAGTPDALTKFLEGFDSPLFLGVQAEIEERLKADGLTDSVDVRKPLVKMLARAVIFTHFEVVQSEIFASQLSALTFLNEHPTSKDDLKKFFYDPAVTNFRAIYEKRPFGMWFGYLQHNDLVVETEMGISISSRGREFLKWRVEGARPAPVFG